MPRFVLALLVALGIGAFAGPALAHVHGGHGAAAVESKAVSAPVAPVAARITAATLAAAPLADDGCDRDCGHTPGMGGCLCMAACAAVTLPDLPTLTPHPVRAAPDPGEQRAWRAIPRGPPTPPPRA